MQRTIRILRIALPLVFAAFILVIALSWTRGGTRAEKPQTQPIATARPNDKPQAESRGFEDTQTVGGRVVSHIVATRVVAYKSAWNTLENVHLTLYRQNGLTYELTCPQADFNSETKEANAKGGVRVVSSDGVDVQTAEIHYDGSRLTNNIPVQFRIDRWTGHAGALDLEVATENLDLKKTLTATMTPLLDTEPMMTIDAVDGVFKRTENSVTFTDKVVMTRGADRISGDVMTGHFTPDRKSLTAMEGHGRIRMVMAAAPAQGENLGGRKVIDCNRFFSELGADGRIAAINAVGEPGMAHAVLDGPPPRDIVARTFRVGLVNRAVHEIKADWNVVMKEFGPAERTTNADHVTVNFDPVQHRAITALLEGAVHFHDPKTDAFAVRANYDVVNDRVLLTAIPGFDPSVTSEGNVVKAHQIEFSPKAQTAKASGEVIAQLVSKGGNGVSAGSTNIFPGGSKEPVFVNADALLMRQGNKTAVFSGNVRAWQEKNTMFSQELQVQGNGDIITARGAVRAMLYNSNDPQRKTPVVSKSDTLTGRKGDRRIDLTGNVEIDDDTRTLTSQSAVFLFDAGHKIERIDAATKVVMVEKATSRKMTGEKAQYLLAKRLVYIDGTPATATGPQGSIAGDHIVYDLARNNVQIASPGSKTEINYNQTQ